MSSSSKDAWPGIGRLFALGGMSECGKSHAGQRFDSAGVRRIKIARILADIGRERGMDLGAADFTGQLHEDLGDEVVTYFLDKVEAEMREYGAVRASIESLYRRSLADGIRERLGDRFVVLFIDAPFDLRVERELIAKGGDRATLSAATRAKDHWKMDRGARDIREIADVIVDNSGTAQQYDATLDQLLRDHPPILTMGRADRG